MSGDRDASALQEVHHSHETDDIKQMTKILTSFGTNERAEATVK